MGSCEEYIELISAYIDGELSQDETERLFKHADNCGRCGSLLGAYRDISADIENSMAEPPPELTKGIMDAVRAEAGRPDTKKHKKRFIFGSYTAAAAVVALAVLAYSSGLFSLGGSADSSGSSMSGGVLVTPNAIESRSEFYAAYDAAGEQDTAAEPAAADSDSGQALSGGVDNAGAGGTEPAATAAPEAAPAAGQVFSAADEDAAAAPESVLESGLASEPETAQAEAQDDLTVTSRGLSPAEEEVGTVILISGEFPADVQNLELVWDSDEETRYILPADEVAALLESLAGAGIEPEVAERDQAVYPELAMVIVRH